MDSTERGMTKGQKCANGMQTRGTHNSIAVQNKLHESNIGFAEEIFLQLGMSDQNFEMWNRKMDNLERKEANCSQCLFDSISPLDTSSISITKEELSFVTESASGSSEVSQDEMNSNDYKEEKTNADCDGRHLCLNNLEKHSHYLDLSSLSETFSCDSDAEGSIMKDEIISLEKHSSDSTGDEMTDTPKKDQLKKEQWGTDAKVTENSQLQQHQYSVAKQLDNVKYLMQANQELTEGLRTKLLQIWCNGHQHEAEGFQYDEISERDTESPVVFSGGESSVASVDGSGQDLVKKQQNIAIKIPVESGQSERSSRLSEISQSAGYVNCLTDHITTVQLQVEAKCSDEKGADLEKDSEQLHEVLQERVTSPKCDGPKMESVDKTSNKEQLVISLKNLESATKEMQEHNQKIMLAKGKIEDTAITVKDRLKKIQWHLSEIEETNRNLHFQIIKLNADYSQIQEHQQCMTCDNKTSANQSVDLQTDLNSAAVENEQMLCLIAKLEKRIEAALSDLSEIKMEKNNLEQQFQSLKNVYNSQEEARIAEREQITKGYGRLISEVEVLRVQSERKRVHTRNLKQEIAAVRSENHRLQQVTEEEMKESKLALQDAKKWKKELHKLTAEHQEKEKQTNIVIQMLKTEIDALKDTSKKREKEIKQNMKMLANIILDMKLVHSDLSAKRPSDKGDCANSMCVKKTSQILSKIDGILSSMEGIFVCQESNTCSSGGLPGGDTDNKGVGDLKERVPAMNNRSRRSNHEECAAINSKVRESLNRSAASHKISKHESVQNNIIKRIEECKMLAAENVKLHNCVKELVCKVNGLNKIIQYADQRLQMNNLHILRLEKKNSVLFVALNKMASKKELRESSAGSTSDSSRASEKVHCSRTEENNFSETGICSAKGSTPCLEMCDYQKESLRLDNTESAEDICSQNLCDKSSQPDIYSICNRKDELCFETETISTLSDISQDDGDHSNNEEKNDIAWNASYCGTDIDKSVLKKEISDKTTPSVVENEDVNSCICNPIPVEGNVYTEEDHQMETTASCKQKCNQTVSHRGKTSDEFKLLAAENVWLHTCVSELQDKIDGLNEIVQIADQRLWMFNMQIIGLEEKNSALIAALNKKSKKGH